MKGLIKKSVLLLLLIISLFTYFIFALTSVSVVSPTINQNVTGNILLNATTIESASNVTFYWYNASDGSLSLTTTIYNDTALDTIFENTSFNTLLLVDGTYNITVNATNSTGTIVTNISITGVTVDNTAPNVVSINSPIANANLSSGTQTFNATITDDTLSVATVRFNVTNDSNFVILTASNPSSNFWVTSIDLNTLAEETHTLIVLANDTVGNLNNSESITFTVDRTAPTVNMVSSSSNTSDTTPSITFNFTDSLFTTASCVLYFNEIAYNASTVNNATNTILTVNTTLSDGSYSVNVNCTDGSNNEGTSSSITLNIDTGNPAITAFNTPASESYNKEDFILNVTITGSPTTVQYLLENGSNSSQVVVAYTGMSNPSGNYWNATINVSAVSDWNYTIRINATDSAGNTNATETLVINIDDTNPTISSFSCNNINQDDTQSCSCSSTDNSQSFGGGVSTSISSASTSTIGTKTVTCTATDSAGNSVTSDTTYVVSSISGSGSTGSSGGISTGIKGVFEKKVWTSINKGETATIEIKNGVIGIKKIEFVVDKTMWGVWIKVNKQENVPSTINPFSKKLYKYIEVTKSVSVKENSLKNININFKVTKSWLTENKLNKENVALFRYVDNKWVKLNTELGKDDEVYQYYNAETPGFSFFAIGQIEEEVIPVIKENSEKEIINGKKIIDSKEKVDVPSKEIDETLEQSSNLSLILLSIVGITILGGLALWFFLKK